MMAVMVMAVVMIQTEDEDETSASQHSFDILYIQRYPEDPSLQQTKRI